MKTAKIIYALLPAMGLTAAVANNEIKYNIAQGPYQGTENSLTSMGHECPEWFRDAKFGIWAHWGPQSIAGFGDWYARHMYVSDGDKYEQLYKDNPEAWEIGHWKSNIGGWEKRSGHKCSIWHRKTYGHQSEKGYKDVCHQWRAEDFDAEKLIAAYKGAGAKYVNLIGHHHDNFDLWDSKFHEWNSVDIGPKKDFVGAFRDAARAEGLFFGVSLHPARTDWFATARVMSDSEGPLKGVLYDGSQTKADGKGTWWEGLDPQKLYGKMGSEGRAYTSLERYEYFLRAKDLIDNYHPDLLYFDQGSLPRGEAGPYIAAHLFNDSIKEHGTNEAVLTIKGLRNYAVPDTERGVVSLKQPYPWQTDTCIGKWFWTRPSVHRWKKADHVIKILVDIVSKNGNLMLSVPMPGSGMLDSRGEAFLKEMGEWMNTNSEGIYGTRPWATFGEARKHKSIGSGHHNESKIKYGSDEFRFTRKGDTIYAFAMGWPKGIAKIRALGRKSPFITGKVNSVELLGHGDLPFKQTNDALQITMPKEQVGKHVFCFKIDGMKTRADTDISSIFYAEEETSLAKPAAKAYTFDALDYGELVGQDDFSVEKSAARIVPVDALQKNRRLSIDKPITISKKGVFKHFNGNEIDAEIAFDVCNPSYSQITVQLIGNGSVSPEIGVISGEVAVKPVQADTFLLKKTDFDCRGKWVRVKLVMNFKTGKGSVYAMNLTAGDKAFKALDSLQNIDMGTMTPAQWDRIDITMQRRHGEIHSVVIDNISIK